MKKKMLLSVALAALVASPALAQQTVRQNGYNPAYRALNQDPGYPGYRAFNQQVPNNDVEQYGYGPGVVVNGGKIVGQDPDPNVRMQLRRDPVSDY